MVKKVAAGFRSLLIAVLLLNNYGLSAITLSDSARVSLLTCTPGDELYSCFGHSAIRVTDYKQGFDFVFNYGTFDFDQPGFYVNFVKGHMIYMLGVDRFEDFKMQYIYEQRDIYEQEIEIGEADKIKVFDFLVNNAREENRNYRYDFLYDNCATRIRDVFTKNIPDVKFDYSTFTEKKSFRDLINDYSQNAPWSQLGMNLLIGLPVDGQAAPAQMCFLPDYLSRGFAHATINGKLLCKEKKIILKVPQKQLEQMPAAMLTPTFVFGAVFVFILIVSYVEYRKKKHFYFIDYPLFFIAGLMGILFFVIGSFTEHTTTQWNLNILWALPTHLIMVFVLPFTQKKKWVLNYFLLAAVLSMVVAVCWKLIPQKFTLPIIFISAIMAVRCYSIYVASRFAGK